MNNQNLDQAQNDIVNVKKILSLVIKNWYWFLITLVMAGSGAYFYTKYALPTYLVSSSILIEDGTNASIPGIENNMLEGFGFRPGSQNLDNQILILSSRNLIRETLDRLPYYSDTYQKRLFKKFSLFPVSPIILIPGAKGAPYNIEFTIHHYSDQVCHLSLPSSSEIELDTFVAFGEEITLHNGSFIILPHPEWEEDYKFGERMYFTFYDRKTLMESYRKRLEIKSATKEGTILTLSLKGTNRAKDILFLDKLAEVYLREQLDKKNNEAWRIIEFIDDQLVDVSDSLIITENQLQEFRSENQVMDVSAQAQQIINRAVVLENERARLKLESRYYDYLNEYLSQEYNNEIPISPSTMGIEDPLLGRLMEELAGLHAEYFSGGITERNPLQVQLEIKISNSKQSIRETLQGIMRANSMAISENNLQIRNLNAQASGLPITEQQLLGFERKFNLNNVLYTFLMQKRAEAQIQKASNRPDNELIDSADSDIEPVAPNMILVYLIAILFGGGLPFLIILIRDSFNFRVTSEHELKLISELPIVGHIPNSRLSYHIVVLSEPQSVVAESFRRLRTRMDYFSRDITAPVILVTSSMPGDGKTFTAINLASAYSLSGKKTLIVGFDLRKPTISQSLNVHTDIGLSTYLIGKTSIENVIVETEFPNLHLLPCGPIPPNPGELANSEKAKEIFSKLRGAYDIIIVDSAPIGVVSDNYSIAAIADITLVMVRHGKTKKNFLKDTLSEAHSNGIQGMCLIFNDMRFSKSSYKYASKYGYE